MRRSIIAAGIAAGALVLTASVPAVAAQGNGQGQGRGSGTNAQECDGTQQHAGQGRGMGHGMGQGGQGQGRGPGQGMGPGQGHGPGQGRGTGQGALGTLTAEQEAEMVYLAEEEKMSGDLYEAFGDLYDDVVFDRIGASEDRHLTAVRGLLTAYELDDPTVGLAPGVFTIPDLQAIYDELLAAGTESVEDAYAAGRTVEETDIAELTDAIEDLDAPRAERVYTNLLRASQMHLLAFTQ